MKPQHSERQNKIYQTAGLCLFLLINTLFIFKYGLRILSPGLVTLAALLYAVFVILTVRFLFKYLARLNKGWAIVLMSVAIICLVGIQMSVNPYEIRADRWSAIHNFIALLLQGEYPYAAQTHLGGYGSPFPVWQLFHIPFYYAGGVALSFVVGSILFVDSLRRLCGFSVAFLSFILMVISPAFVYEVAAWSDLITNFMICASILFYLRHFRITLQSNFILIALIIGLMASTRVSVLVPFFIYFLRPYLSAGLHKQILFPLIIILVFALTFLPFVLWDGEMLFFFEHNPFSLQSRQSSPLNLIIFIPLSVWLALMWKSNFRKYLFSTSVALVLFVGIAFTQKMYVHDNWDQIFEPFYDITYFDMALPFLTAFIVLQNQRLRQIKSHV